MIWLSLTFKQTKKKKDRKKKTLNKQTYLDKLYSKCQFLNLLKLSYI